MPRPFAPAAALPQSLAKRFLARVFYGVYFILFGWVVLNIAFTTTDNNLANVLLACALLAGLCLLYRRTAPALDAAPKRRVHIAVGLAFAVYGALLLVLNVFMLTVPISDFAIVLTAVQRLINTGSLGNLSGYFSQCQNQFGVLILLYLWYKLLSFVGISPGLGENAHEGLALHTINDTALYAGAVLNVLVLLLTLFTLWRTALLLYRRQSAGLFVLVLGFLFAPWALWTPYFYTDTLSMIFPLAALFFYLKARRSEQFWAAALRYALAAALVFCGYKVKGSIFIVLAALLIHLLMSLPWRRALAAAAVLLCVFLVLSGLFTLYIHNNAWYDDTNHREIQPPIWLWFALASHGDGEACQCERCVEMMLTPGRAERTRVALEWLRENYASYTETELTAFLTHKAVLTWGRGTYEALDYTLNAKHGSWTQAFTAENGPLRAPLSYWCNAFNLMLLVALMVQLYQGVRRARFGAGSVLHITLFGVFFFFSFYETHARYILNFTPVLVLAAAGGLMHLAQHKVQPFIRRA